MKQENQIFLLWLPIAAVCLYLNVEIASDIGILASIVAVGGLFYYRGKDAMLKEFDDWMSFTVSVGGIKCDSCQQAPHLTGTSEDKWLCDGCLQKQEGLNTSVTRGNS